MPAAARGKGTSDLRQLSVRSLSSAAVSEPLRRRAVPDYLSRSQMELLKAIGNRPVTAAQLAVQTGQPVEEILSSLVELEIYGLIESHGPAGYTAL